MSHLISVIVPVYNTAPFLEECISSILSQTYALLEVILVDDGSTDDSGLICDRIANEDNRIRVIHQPNAGLGAARNTGLSIASGDYIMFIDSDDYININCCKTLLETVLRTDCDIVTGGFNKETVHGIFQIRRDFDHEMVFDKSSIPDIINAHISPIKSICSEILLPSVCLSLFRRPVITHGFMSEREIGSEDMLFRITALLNSHKICYIPDCNYYYRLTPGSLTRRFDLSIVQHYSKLVREIDKLTGSKTTGYLMLKIAIDVIRRIYYNDFNISERRFHIKSLCEIYDWKSLEISLVTLSMKEKAFYSCLASRNSLVLLLIAETYYRIRPVK